MTSIFTCKIWFIYSTFLSLSTKVLIKKAFLVLLVTNEYDIETKEPKLSRQQSRHPKQNEFTDAPVTSSNLMILQRHVPFAELVLFSKVVVKNE